jgi:cAMP-dependent protein kinase regulator
MAMLTHARQQFADRRFIMAGTIAAVVWLMMVFVTGCVLFQANAVDILHRFYMAGGLRYTGLVVVGALASIILGVAGFVIWIVIGYIRAWFRERAARRKRMQITGTSPGAVAELLSHVVLFRDLPPDALQQVAAAMKPVEYKRGDFVIRAGEEADRLFVVVLGRLEVVRHYEGGKADVVAEMIPGDVLGEIAVLQGGTRTRSIRAASRSLLVALTKADFERLVLAHVTRAEAIEAVQKVGFLQNIALVKNWPQQSLAAFARLAVIHEYNENDLVVREGSDNLYLYLVHRGEFAVMQNGKLLRKLKPGDSYGELGILQNRTATTSVVASKAGSCMAVSKDDFLKFITQDFTISLQFEELGARRFGRTGPTKVPGFDVMRA